MAKILLSGAGSTSDQRRRRKTPALCNRGQSRWQVKPVGGYDLSVAARAKPALEEWAYLLLVCAIPNRNFATSGYDTSWWSLRSRWQKKLKRFGVLNKSASSPQWINFSAADVVFFFLGKEALRPESCLSRNNAPSNLGRRCTTPCRGCGGSLTLGLPVVGSVCVVYSRELGVRSLKPTAPIACTVPVSFKAGQFFR